MGDITDQHEQTSPPDVAEPQSVGNGGSAPNESRGVKRQRTSADDDDDEDEKGGRERRKIEIKFISDKSRRHITFSKRKAGIMKKVGRAFRGVNTSLSSSKSPLRRAYCDDAIDGGADLHPTLRLTNLSPCRPTSCQFSLARKYYYWSFRKPAWSTHSRRQNSSPS